MTDTVKVPYGNGFEDATAVELPESLQPPPFEIKLSDGNQLKVELRIMNVFRLLEKQTEKGEPIYLLSVQLKTETIGKAGTEAVSIETEE